MTKQVSVLQILSQKSRLAFALAAGPSFHLVGTRIGERVDGFTGTQAEYIAQAKADFESYQTKLDLLKNYNAAIILANNLVQVEVGGDTITVAEAISSRKIFQITYQAFIKAAQFQLGQANTLVNRSLTDVETQIDRQKAALSAGSKVASEETLKALRADIERNNLRKVVDPNGIEKIMNVFRERQEELDQEFNLAIQVANAQVFVQIDDRGFVDLAELRSRLTQK